MKNEKTSKRVASVAAKGLRGPTEDQIEDGYCHCPHFGRPAFAAGARWWHRQVKAVLASALTQAADKPGRKRVR